MGVESDVRVVWSVKVLLIDVDSKIPNLALMKISAYHKFNGDEVGFNVQNPDKVYISCIFSRNRTKAIGIPTLFRCVCELGGYGINDKQLPSEVEHIMPDYDLYRCDYSFGFTTRGCIRNCDFCIVPKKEGKIKFNADIYEFWDKRH